MKTDKKLKIIEKQSFEMGNTAYEKFKETGGFAALRSSVDAYKVTMQSIRYQLIYNNLKKNKK
jgi:hypothetical protein